MTRSRTFHPSALPSFHSYALPFLASLITATLLPGCASSPKADRPAPKGEMADGVYEGGCAQLPNIAKVRVTVKDHRIAAIEILSHIAWKGKKAEGPIVERILAKQSTQVDAVTGATNSSQTLMRAVQDAIEKAYAK